MECDMKRNNQFERTDRDITNALLALMDRKTFEKITVQDILDEALINRSTFYQHFPDKYAILERLQEQVVLGMMNSVSEVTKEKILDLNVINTVLFSYLSERREIMLKLSSVRSETLNLEKQMQDFFVSWLQADNHVLSAVEQRILAGMMVTYMTDCLKNNIDFSAVSTEMLDMWLNMSIFFFRLQDKPDAKEKLLGLIRELHGVS